MVVWLFVFFFFNNRLCYVLFDLLLLGTSVEGTEGTAGATPASGKNNVCCRNHEHLFFGVYRCCYVPSIFPLDCDSLFCFSLFNMQWGGRSGNDDVIRTIMGIRGYGRFRLCSGRYGAIYGVTARV